MTNVFVWTFQDVVGLVVLGVILFFLGIAWIIGVCQNIAKRWSKK